MQTITKMNAMQWVAALWRLLVEWLVFGESCERKRGYANASHTRLPVSRPELSALKDNSLTVKVLKVRGYVHNSLRDLYLSQSRVKRLLLFPLNRGFI
jgi:hypothetical protein